MIKEIIQEAKKYIIINSDCDELTLDMNDKRQKWLDYESYMPDSKNRYHVRCKIFAKLMKL